MNNILHAGLEISKDTLLVSLPESARPQRKEFPNTRGGHRQLVKFLQRFKRPVRVGCEATGTYGLDVALALHAAEGIEIAVLNPRRVKDFAKARGHVQKSDPRDADLLREFVANMDFRPWQPPSSSALELRQITRRIITLTAQRTAETNRRHAARATGTCAPIVDDSVRTVIEHLGEQIRLLEQSARQLVRQDPALERRYGLLTSVTGIGPRSALLLLGELAVLSDGFTARQWVSLAALFPRVERSGTSVYRRRGIGPAGNRYLRYALFMPALTAVRHCPPLREFHQRLVDRGFTPLQAVVAVMRRLLHIIHALFKNDTAFDVTRVGTRKIAPAA